MTSKEIVRAVVRHNDPPRLGWDFYDSCHRDIAGMPVPELKWVCDRRYEEWGEYPELREKCGFHGELRLDELGNIYGRLNGKTKGECVMGALQAGWEGLKDYRLPQLDPDWSWTVPESSRDKYVIAGMMLGVFSSLRDVRRIDNALMDTVLEKDMVKEFLRGVVDVTDDCVRAAARCGADAIIIYDDWGTQKAPFVSPASFAELFKPAYADIASVCHEVGVDFILHSCGMVRPLVDDMIDAGIDMFQFDQPELSGSEFWAETYGRKAAFYCPVDIQKVMPTGDRAVIEAAAKRMANAFRACGGSLVVKDYGGPDSWKDINVEPEWVDWARNAIVENSRM